ncbi:MAG: hypothetical protein JJ862_11940 [Roseivirga sp.]|uniref:hypothetical protein n=1 Tax=Roseivirga sp. TaxID=1964215 RepID=UPI001B1B3A7C|nr:hypothetical protein [Roseivirga sp.]MBO6661016.1 hypothetical protein [Roseivirga sp.]MBO6909000.1 hypothetical protein [Roseivirga sp.]
MSKSKRQILTDFEIEKILGKPIKFDFKSKTTLGSTSFFLKKLESPTENTKLKENSKCSFQKYELGILLKAYLSSSIENVPIRFDSIAKLIVIKGNETVNPSWYSPMSWLLKLGLPLRKARYFRLHLSEYHIDQMTLIIQSEEFLLEMIASGYMFESQLKFFQSIISRETLSIVYS